MPPSLFEKIWYIKFGDSDKEGPYSIVQLRNDPRVTPDTLVWKEGFSTWVPIREVLELAVVFEDSDPLDEKPELPNFVEKNGDEMVLDMGYDMPPFYLWALILILLGLFILIQTYR